MICVTYLPPGAKPGSRVEIINRCATMAEAEACIEARSLIDPEGVNRGDYGIDAPGEA